MRGRVLEAAFEEINRQLDAAGLSPAQGHADGRHAGGRGLAPCRPTRPARGARHAREPGADWTRKKGRGFFGYKAHIGVDQGSGLIRRAVLSSAKTYESEVAERLICGDEAAVYGDRPTSSRRDGPGSRPPGSRIASCTGATCTWPRCRLAEAPQRSHSQAPGAGRSGLLGAEAALRAETGQELLAERNAARLFAVATAYNLRRASLLADA